MTYQTFVDMERWHAEGAEVAVATVVGVHGSSPRPAGARMCVTRDGRMSGSVSGGCVEADVWRRAVGVLDDGNSVLAHFSIDAKQAGGDLGVGLSCGGAIDVLIERFRDDDVQRAAAAARRDARVAVLALALAPAQLLGRRMAVTARAREASALEAAGASDVAAVGSIDPDLDAAIASAAAELLRGGRSGERRSFARGEEQAIVFFETLAPPERLYIVGATDTAAALLKIAKTVGFDVVVVDARAAYARRDRFADAADVVCAWPDEAFAHGALDERSFVVTLAHDPKLDVPALACALRSRAAYVGALGSRRTHERRKQALRELGFDDAALARIHSPVGLDLGGRSPAEIALAIAAEMVATRYGRTLQARTATVSDDDVVAPRAREAGRDNGAAAREDRR